MYPEKRVCKHLKRCGRVYNHRNKQEKQILLIDYLSQQEGLNEVYKEKSYKVNNHE
jgi:bacillopeptidase F (M6 metalloprotease family)